MSLRSVLCAAQELLVPMDRKQADHLKAYGAIYGALAAVQKVDWCSTTGAARRQDIRLVLTGRQDLLDATHLQDDMLSAPEQSPTPDA